MAVIYEKKNIFKKIQNKMIQWPSMNEWKCQHEHESINWNQSNDQYIIVEFKGFHYNIQMYVFVLLVIKKIDLL